LNYKDLIKHIKHLDSKYNCLDNEIELLIQIEDGDTVIGTLTDVDVWQNGYENYGLDFISKIKKD